MNFSSIIFSPHTKKKKGDSPVENIATGKSPFMEKFDL